MLRSVGPQKSRFLAGLRETAQSRFNDFFSHVHRQAVAYVLELADLAAAIPAPETMMLPEGYTFRMAEIGDLAACAVLARTPLEEYQRRWRQGGQCYVTFHDERPVNLNWLHFGSCYVRGLGLFVEAPLSECYLYNVLTDRAYRGLGLYKITQRRLIEILTAERITRIRQVVMDGNRVPLETLPKLGYALTERVRYRHLCGLNVATTETIDGRRLSRRRFWRRPASVFWI